MKSIYVGNLAYSATNQDLVDLFTQFGKVESVKLINDRETGRPKGFGFIEMDDESALKAISSLDNTEFMGRKIKVNEANPKK
ncbi:Rna-binding protein [Helicobacter fennelliae]|uniref:RNA-binding protein n=2 Tax=Helicobacter fennelliae TaxID=215 RepID=T1DUT9_9HELI|nr:RNA-binding protein [Helicobacter fennelliae]GAD18203.1 RNA-binding protein [Helicobacter fennelliae MRY12-0050]SQB98003.1 Rna-binding protein [Helicobacter fennelliae]STP06787.1 Rna-binding protein [Helicobacter fennelliae]STQ83659.1 Rna-binding protein [Helicobacter fennelliae]